MEIPKSFLGYKRENGRAGTRNHVIILPVDDISNACSIPCICKTFTKASSVVILAIIYPVI